MRLLAIALVPVLLALSMVYYPPFFVTLCLFVDFYTPWVIFDSSLYEKYHTFITRNLPEKEEIPLPEITAKEANMETVLRLSHDLTFPLVIRGLLGNSSAVQQWGSHDFWIDNYGDEELLCGLPGEDPVPPELCTVRGFFEAWKQGRPFYISGASKIFERHPELHEMIDNEAIRALEPGVRTATQVFLGLPGMGSDVHSAIGINIFRQVAGHKKWWFIPPSETCYLWPALNVNGFSAHTLTKIGKGGSTPSPWLKKLTRYTIVLNPGDVLINPPWFWHGIDNIGEPDELIIGSPTRYSGQVVRPSFKTNPVFTYHAFFRFFLTYGPDALKPGFKPNLQKDIDKNRVVRTEELDEAKAAENAHPFDEEE